MRRRNALAALVALGCARARDEHAVVFLHQPLWGDRGPLDALLNEFRRTHPLTTRTVPSASDVLHQYLLTTLEGGGDADVFVVDTIWVPELARAGLIAALPDALDDFVPAAAAACRYDGRTYAIPWWVDVGVLFTRTDRATPPRTYRELAAIGGYVFQGRQYEGLLCNAFELIWGHGGGSSLAINTPEARAAMTFLASLVRDGISPKLVTSAGEEECRRAFEAGRATVMRNWPYAWAELQRSPIAGRVAMTALPSRDGGPGHGCLGGFHLAISAKSRKLDASLALIRHLTSFEAQSMFARAYGRPPSRRAVYSGNDPLGPIVEHARSRPVSPWYPRVSDALQGELSAIVSGIRAPAEALERAQRHIDRLVGA